MHDKGVIRSNLEETNRLSVAFKSTFLHPYNLQWDLSSPDREVASVMDSKFARDRGNVVDEAKILEREKLRRWRWVDVEIWEWKAPSLLPTFNLRLNFWSPQ